MHQEVIGGDIFGGDEEAVGAVIRSLIDTNGIQSWQQRVVFRLEDLQSARLSAEARLDHLPQEYLGLEAWGKAHNDHTKKIDDHNLQIEMLENNKEDVLSRLDGLDDKVEEILERLQKIEEWREYVQPNVDKAIDTLEELEERTKAQMESIQEDIRKESEKAAADFQDAKDDAALKMKQMRRDIDEAEQRTREYTEREVKRVMGGMYGGGGGGGGGDDAADGSVEKGEFTHGDDGKAHSREQALMLEFVNTNLVAPINNNLKRTMQQLRSLFDDFETYRHKTDRDVIGIQKTQHEHDTKTTEKTDGLTKAVATCATKVALKEVNEEMKRLYKDLSNENVKVNGRLDKQFAEVSVHLDVIRGDVALNKDHLTSVDIELADRPRKADLAHSNKLIDKCTTRAEFLKDSAEIRDILNWQSTKIENFGLTVNAINGGKLGGRGGGKKYRMGRNSNRGPSALGRSSVTDPSRASRASVHSVERTSKSRSASPVGRESRELAEKGSPAPTPGLKEVDEQDELETRAGDSVQQLSKGDLDNALDRELAESDEEVLYNTQAQDEESEEEDEEEDMGGGMLLRQQLETLSMALVGLGFLTLLKEPKLGMARDVRLRREKDMLDELQNLRHWVTNRVRPSGWDPAKIVTLALSCAHPRDDEVRRVLPQVSLKGLQDEPRSLRRQIADADAAPPLPTDHSGGVAAAAPPLGSGGYGGYAGGVPAPPMAPSLGPGGPEPPATGGTLRPAPVPPPSARVSKMATSTLVSKHLAKAPLTARGPGEAGALLLPPLTASAIIA